EDLLAPRIFNGSRCALNIAHRVAGVKGHSCPTRCEPGARLVIPTRNAPGGGLGEVVWRLMGSTPARRVDHRSDGDRHERGTGAHAETGAPGDGGNPGPGVPPGRAWPGAGLPAALERLQPRPGDAAGLA